jgi:hypothetical protein
MSKNYLLAKQESNDFSILGVIKNILTEQELRVSVRDEQRLGLSALRSHCQSSQAAQAGSKVKKVDLWAESHCLHWSCTINFG